MPPSEKKYEINLNSCKKGVIVPCSPLLCQSFRYLCYISQLSSIFWVILWYLICLTQEVLSLSDNPVTLLSVFLYVFLLLKRLLHVEVQNFE